MGPETIASSDDLLRFFGDRTSDVYWTADANGNLTYVAPQVSRLLERSPSELVGVPVRALVHEQDAPQLASLRETLLANAPSRTVTYRLVRANGDVVWVDATVHVVLSSDDAAVTFAGVWRDVTDRKVIEEALEHQAYHDTLTGLPNRRLLEDRLAIALAQARRLNALVAVLVISIDRLAMINHTLGRATGDEVLRVVARRLLSRIRASDTLARVGDHEFTVVAFNIRQDEDTVRIAQLLIKQVNEPMTIDTHELYLTVSIGIAIFPQDAQAVSPLLAGAEEAMRECRHTGGNGWQLQRESVNERALERLAVEMDLHRAVQRTEFEVRYQPLFAVAGQQMIAVEALVRWQHPTRGELSPASFLDIAEETGLIVAIGRQVIHLACAQARRWLDEGWESVSVAINLSARQFEHPELLDFLDRAVAEHGVPASVLQVEITEGTALRDLERGLRVLAELRRRGIRVAVDDFGIGYSSLAYLKRLTIDTLKIDKAFLAEVPGARDGAIVAAVIAMGHALGLTVIAEGVEREDQMTFLREHGCDFCQGFLFGKPTTAAEISRMR